MKARLASLIVLAISLNAQAEVAFVCGGISDVMGVGRLARTIAVVRDKHEYLSHTHEVFSTGAPDRHHTEFGTFVGDPPDMIFTPTAYVSDSTGTEVVTRESSPRPYRVHFDWLRDGRIQVQKRPMIPRTPGNPMMASTVCIQGAAGAAENATMLFTVARRQGLLPP